MQSSSMSPERYQRAAQKICGGRAKGAALDFDRALDLMEVLNNLVLVKAPQQKKEVIVETP